MIKKKRTKSYTILAYEALFRRLKKNDSNLSRIQKDYLKHITGYRGEEMVDYKLRTQTNSDFRIFHDLRFRVNHHFFQIDTLILTSSFLLILEIKNIKGILEYDSDLQQLI